MTMTLERMRADVARTIDMEPSEIGDDDHLPDLGLDSMRMMQLLMSWDEAGLKGDFSVFAEYSTLGDWWREVAVLQADA